MRAGILSRLVSALCNDRPAPPPPKPTPRGLAFAKAAALKMIDETTFPTPWRKHADGRTFRVTAMQWVDGRGVVPTIEWLD